MDFRFRITKLLKSFIVILGCGGFHTDDTGVITSPNYPDVYNNKANCEWVVTVDSGNIIFLTFTTIHLETRGSSECYDYVEVCYLSANQ